MEELGNLLLTISKEIDFISSIILEKGIEKGIDSLVVEKTYSAGESPNFLGFNFQLKNGDKSVKLLFTIDSYTKMNFLLRVDFFDKRRHSFKATFSSEELFNPQTFDYIFNFLLSPVDSCRAFLEEEEKKVGS